MTFSDYGGHGSVWTGVCLHLGAPYSCEQHQPLQMGQTRGWPITARTALPGTSSQSRITERIRNQMMTSSCEERIAFAFCATWRDGRQLIEHTMRLVGRTLDPY